MQAVQGRERGLSALLVLASTAALIALYLKPPQAYGIPPCPFYFLTGAFCPGCGALRAIHSLLHGHLVRAIGFNPLLIFLLPLLALAGAGEALTAVTAKRWRIGLPPRWGWAVFALIVTFWVLRNVPGPAFDSLRPVRGNPRLQVSGEAYDPPPQGRTTQSVAMRRGSASARRSSAP
jgi:hypothetical protein